MISLKNKRLLLLIIISIFYTNANAFFFFFIPGGAVRSASDALTGAKGNICVKDSVKVGDIVPSLSGNTMTVTSLSGTSSMCTNPALPIRADVDYKFTFQSSAGINLSEDYEAKPLNDFQRYSGTILIASAKSTRNKGILINAREKKPNSDPQDVATAIEKQQILNLSSGETKNAEKITINDMSAWRFEVHGKTKGVFGTDMVYLVTVLEGDNEILLVNAYTTESNFNRDRDELKNIAAGISGLKVTTPSLVNKPINASPQPDTKNEIDTNQSSNTSQLNLKLRDLQKLFNEGLINKQDYENKKTELLKNF
jgi:hypothetical protein